MQAIKCSLKYLYKGADLVTVTIEDFAAAGCIAEQVAVTINEVREFQNKCYVSGAEAACHQCQNEVADRNPAVNRLQWHLPGEQTVYFDSSKRDESIEQIEQLSKLNKLNSLLSLRLIAKIHLHNLYCTSKFLNTTDATPKRGNGREEKSSK